MKRSSLALLALAQNAGADLRPYRKRLERWERSDVVGDLATKIIVAMDTGENAKLMGHSILPKRVSRLPSGRPRKKRLDIQVKRMVRVKPPVKS